jgi:hypothetical protein
MKNYFILFCITVMFSSASMAADKAVPSAAQKMHDGKCMTCHKTEVYTREDRRVKSLQALTHQVETCMKGPADANWSAAETTAVIDYLNSKFYKF